MKQYKNDIIFICTLLVVAFAIYLCSHFLDEGLVGSKVTIQIDGQIVATLDLNENRTYKAKSKNGLNVISIKDGKVSVIDADCKDKICVHQGVIFKKNENIICLPNKIIVTIENNKENDIDAVAR